MVSPNLKPIIIAGPTGLGKSKLGLYLAKRFQGEIICADSRQFYKSCEISTAQPKPSELIEIPHHGYGLIDPKTQKVDAGFFIEFANKAIEAIKNKNKRPIIVGGTGLYLRALKWGLDAPKKDEDIRKDLYEKYAKLGSNYLYEELKRIDEKACQKISSKDHIRIIRALEIYYLTSKKPSGIKNSFSSKEAKINGHFICLYSEKIFLYDKLFNRVNHMYENGLLEETKNLLNILPQKSFIFDIPGIKEAKEYIENKISLEKAKELTFIRHRQYAKRQITWFKKESFYSFLNAQVLERI